MCAKAWIPLGIVNYDNSVFALERQSLSIMFATGLTLLLFLLHLLYRFSGFRKNPFALL